MQPQDIKAAFFLIEKVWFPAVTTTITLAFCNGQMQQVQMSSLVDVKRDCGGKKITACSKIRHGMAITAFHYKIIQIDDTI